MNSKSKLISYFTFLIFVFIACSQALYIPTLEDSQRTGISTETLILGRNLYVKNCGSCHNLYKAEYLTKDEWAKVIPVMQKKAKCTIQETTLITKYLIARSK